MRVLIWQEKPPDVIGGAESWITDTAGGLRARGHEVAWLWSAQIGQALDSFKPDAVILGTLHNWVGLEHVKALAHSLVPGVWMLHDYWPWCGYRMLMRDHNRSERQCEAATARCRNSCGGEHPVPPLLKRFRLVTGCEGAARVMRRHGLDVGVVEEGVDTSLFQPAAKGEASVVYASVATNNPPWKGMRWLKEALGDTEVRLLRGLPREQVAAQLSQAAIFVFPSLYEEIWGLALTEAMACGCAVVTTNVAGGLAQVEHQVNGLVVNKGDVAGLRRAVRLLQADAGLRERLGRAARAHVEASHSLESVGKRWEEVLSPCAVL